MRLWLAALVAHSREAQRCAHAQQQHAHMAAFILASFDLISTLAILAWCCRERRGGEKEREGKGS